ncbi:hypothetical protein ACE6H2_017194 [Prunus campanulata]
METPKLSYRFICLCGRRFSNRNLLLSHSALDCFNHSPLFCGGGLERTFCRVCGECCADLPTRNHHEASAHWNSQFDVSSCFNSDSGLQLFLTGQENNLSCQADLLCYLENFPDGVVAADLDAYIPDLEDLVHSQHITILQSDAVGDVVYPIRSLGFDEEMKRLFFQSNVRDIDSVLKCQRMQGSKTWAAKRAAADSNEKNKRFKGL